MYRMMVIPAIDLKLPEGPQLNWIHGTASIWQDMLLRAGVQLPSSRLTAKRQPGHDLIVLLLPDATRGCAVDTTHKPHRDEQFRLVC